MTGALYALAVVAAATTLGGNSPMPEVDGTHIIARHIKGGQS